VPRVLLGGVLIALSLAVTPISLSDAQKAKAAKRGLGLAPVRSIGSDPHGLDGDDDGIGCE
jgi:hypothetical protein